MKLVWRVLKIISVELVELFFESFSSVCNSLKVVDTRFIKLNHCRLKLKALTLNLKGFKGLQVV